MAYKLTWLADVLRAAGCTVAEVDGWKDRGRGDVGTIDAVIAHHTGPGKDANLLKLILNGRPDLAGPLSQLFLDRQGTYHVLAAGRCNHAGNGSWHGATGNSDTIGIEAANAGDGKEAWPAAQMRAYIVGVAAILRHRGKDELGVAGHKEFATPRGRKIDPSFDMFEFRERVAEAIDDLNNGVAVRKPLPGPAGLLPKQSMLRKGDRGESVKILQIRLNGWAQPADRIKIDGDFGPATDRLLRAYQAAANLTVDGKAGPATWKSLGE